MLRSCSLVVAVTVFCHIIIHRAISLTQCELLPSIATYPHSNLPHSMIRAFTERDRYKAEASEPVERELYVSQ